MKKPSILFMGTPDFAVSCLEALHQEGYPIIGVVTQPDRPKGRGGKMMAPPVKVKAEELGFPVFQPLKVKTPEFYGQLAQWKPDLIIVVAFGQILSKEILDAPPLGCVNVHASLLPKYRGAAPIHWSVMDGERETGVTTMFMDVGLDTGDMILKKTTAIGLDDTVGQVHDRLAELGAQCLLETVALLADGQAPREPQGEGATYASLLKREHEEIHWDWPAVQVHNRVRGMNPWPGAYTNYQGGNLKIWRTSLEGASPWEKASESPGIILALTREGIVLQTGDGPILLTEVQPAGGKRMGAGDFARGHRLQKGELFQ